MGSVRSSKGMRFVAVLTMAAGVLVGRPIRAAAVPNPKDLVQAKLIADVDSVKAGKPFNLAIHFKIKPEWHLYWKYPGDAGLPPRVKWNLPEGFTAGGLRFPIPVKDDLPGGIVAYAYHDELLVTATITPPNNLDAGRSLTFAADLSWLVCQTELCLPGKAAGVSIDLPVGEGKPANEDVFAAWESRFPGSPEQLKQFVEETGEFRGDKFGAMIQFTGDMKDVAWFPNPPKGVGVENLRESSQTSLPGHSSVVMFDLVPPPKTPTMMSFLVVLTDPENKRRGVEFTVNLTPPATAKK